MSRELLISTREKLKKILRGYYLDGFNTYDIFKHNLIEKNLVFLYITSGYYTLYMNNNFPQKIMIGDKLISLRCKDKKKEIKRERSFISERDGIKSNLYQVLMDHQVLITSPKSFSTRSSFSDEDMLTF